MFSVRISNGIDSHTDMQLLRIIMHSEYHLPFISKILSYHMCQAEQMLADKIAEYPDQSYDADANTLFSDWVQMWLDSVKTYIQTSTWEGYTLNAKHIMDYLQKR